MIDIFITTLIKRPYVFAFLISYLFIAGKTIGWKPSWLLLITGYVLAFISEYCSINYGIPYGWYHYIYENLKGEWLNHGVPVWDSASYVFMNFAGLCAACHVFKPEFSNGWNNIRQKQQSHIRFKILLLSALLVTLLDVVTDPLAHLGEKWFLGKIYYYPTPGFYFDVTFANFLGWFVTSLSINGVALYIFDFCKKAQFTTTNWILCLGLYYGIFAFTLGITIYINEWLIVFCDIIWIMLTILIVSGRFRKKVF